MKSVVESKCRSVQRQCRFERVTGTLLRTSSSSLVTFECAGSLKRLKMFSAFVCNMKTRLSKLSLFPWLKFVDWLCTFIERIEEYQANVKIEI